MSGRNSSECLLSREGSVIDDLVVSLDGRKRMGDDMLTPASSPSKRQRLSNNPDPDEENLMAKTILSHDDYTVGWICALPIEMAAAKAMLDTVHKSLPNVKDDMNTYTLGSISNHNIAIACLPSGYYGTTNAASVANNMRRSFPSLRAALMVGIGGGVPSKEDVRLGDVVVGVKVVQYDLGKTVQGGSFERTAIIHRPPPALLTAVAKLQADHNTESSRIPSLLSRMIEGYPSMTKYTHPGPQQDLLFESDYDHIGKMANCERCSISRLVHRPNRDNNTYPKIFYGCIASGNQVMKDGQTRDRLGKELDILCFEMEAAGLMDSLPCLVIRGICDYSDGHKNKQWQKYAAATAAAYAKELVSVIHAHEVEKEQRAAMPSVDPDRQQRLLESLKFENIDSSRSRIKPSHGTTCEWLLGHPAYQDWLDPHKALEHRGMLWIRGKPGTGKSTIMKFAYDQARKGKESIVISFFFNARGDILERSIVGMYRSLLFQLLNALPRLLQVFDGPENRDEVHKLHKVIAGQSKIPDWPVVLLQGLLQSAIDKLDQENLMFFIDALDECGEDQVEEIVDYFENLGCHAVSNKRRVAICFSSRHYPHIDIQYGSRLTLEDQEGHEGDITTYILSKLRVGENIESGDIRNEIQMKASGIFMWVVLVVDILNTEYKHGRMFAVQERLETIPTKLGNLFREILWRDKKHLPDLKICIQWILFSKRPLKLEEFYFAAVSGLEPNQLCEWDQKKVTREDMNRFLLSSSKGLAEATRGKIPVIQFIHESVREFFLKDGLPELWPNLPAADFESISHKELRKCCHTYMQLDISKYVGLNTPLPKSRSGEAKEFKELRTMITDKFPLLEYATRHVLYHADKAAARSPQDRFLQNFPLQTWIFLNNFFEPYDIRRYTATASLLYVLANSNFAKLIGPALHLDPRIDIEGERYHYPIFAALANGHQEVMNAFLQNGADPPQPEISKYPEWGISFKPPRDQTPLHWAAINGHNDFVQLLLEKGAYLEAKDHSDWTPLSWAAGNGHRDTVQLLLEKGANLETKDHSAWTPLSWAAGNGHRDTVQLLLEKGADLEAKDCNGRTSLSWAAEKGYKDTIQLLLEKGADLEAKDHYGWASLAWTAESEHKDTVQLLLDKGADLEAKDYSGRTLLSWTAESGYKNTVQLLLEKGADPEAKDDSGWTPLSWAAENGHTDTVELLLEKGADLEAKDCNGWTPLSWAAENGHKDTVQLLLEKGADIKAKDCSRQALY